MSQPPIPSDELQEPDEFKYAEGMLEVSKSTTPEDDKRDLVCSTLKKGKRRRTSKSLSLATNQLSEEDSNNIKISDDTQELVPTTSSTQIIQAISATNQSEFQPYSIKPKDLWSFVCGKKCTIQINPILLMVTGLPQCGKSKYLKNALQRAMSSTNEAIRSRELDQQGNDIYSTELSAVVSPLLEHPMYFETSKETTYLCAIESALKLNYLRKSKYICDYALQESANICENDPDLNVHLHEVMKALKNHSGEKKFNHKWKQQYDLFDDLTLINIWDMGMNKAAFHFLPALWGKLGRSFMWLFFEVDRDLYNLNKRPNCSENDVMPYRTRHRYLFREAMLAQTKKEKPDCCSIVGIRKSKKIDDNIISDRIIEGAIPMGVDNIIEKKVILLDEDDKYAYDTLRRKMDEIVRKGSYRQKDIPLSFIFLRSFYSYLDKVFVRKQDLEKKAELLKIKDASQMKEFYELFSSSGSIIDLDHPDIDFVIMKPMEFIKELNDLFAPRDEIDSDGLLKEYGLLTIETAKAIFGETEYSYFLEVLTAVNLALKIKKGEMIYIDDKAERYNDEVYYIPDVRKTSPDLTNHTNSLLLRMSINSSFCHMQVLFAEKYLATCTCKSENLAVTLRLEKSCEVNLTKFQIGTDVLCLQYLGEVIEFRFTNGHPTKEVARTIIDACCEIMNSDDQLHATSYNFAIKCSKSGEFKGADRIAQPHHIVVPYDKTKDERCKCTAMKNVWNNVLKTMADEHVKKIPEDRLLQLKPISDSDISNVVTALHSLSDVTKDKFIEQLNKDVLSETGESLKVSMEYSERLTYMHLFEWEKRLSESSGIKCSSTDLAILLMKLAKDSELANDQKTTLQNLARKLDILVDVIPLEYKANDSESQS